MYQLVGGKEALTRFLRLCDCERFNETELDFSNLWEGDAVNHLSPKSRTATWLFYYEPLRMVEVAGCLRGLIVCGLIGQILGRYSHFLYGTAKGILSAEDSSISPPDF